jgi:hypothetical protein
VVSKTFYALAKSTPTSSANGSLALRTMALTFPKVLENLWIFDSDQLIQDLTKLSHRGLKILKEGLFQPPYYEMDANLRNIMRKFDSQTIFELV